MSIWEQFVPHFYSGKLAGEDLKALQESLALIAQTEAYQNYGIPSRSLIKAIISLGKPLWLCELVTASLLNDLF